MERIKKFVEKLLEGMRQDDGRIVGIYDDEYPTSSALTRKELQDKEREADAVLEENPNDIEMLGKRAETRFKLGNYQGVQQDTVKALALDPKAYECYALRGLAAAAQQEHTSALSDITFALENGISSEKLYEEQQRVLVCIAKIQLAKLEKGERASVNPNEAVLYKAFLLIASGEEERAANEYKLLANKDNMRMDIQLLMGMTYALGGLYRSALGIFNQMQEEGKEVAACLGLIQLWYGEYDKASETFSHVSEDHQHPIELGDAGLAAAFKGDFDKARRLIDAALKIDPNSQLLRDDLNWVNRSDKLTHEFATGVSAGKNTKVKKLHNQSHQQRHVEATMSESLRRRIQLRWRFKIFALYEQSYKQGWQQLLN